MAEDDNFHEALRPRDNPEGLSRFEIEAWKWRSLDRLLAVAREAAQQYDLDPELLATLEDTCREADTDAILEAMADFYEAVVVARGDL
jgi:hypothetical protein